MEGACYAERGFLGGFIWTALDRTPIGGTFQTGRIRVYSFKGLLGAIRSLRPGSIWRHNQAGDLPSDNQTTIDRKKLRAITAANQGRRGFTYTHFDVETNFANRAAIAEANKAGFVVNLSANSLEHADRLADLHIAPIAVLVPAGSTANTRTPKGRPVVICPARTHPGVTCATCMLCARERSVMVGLPMLGARRTSP